MKEGYLPEVGDVLKHPIGRHTVTVIKTGASLKSFLVQPPSAFCKAWWMDIDEIREEGYEVIHSPAHEGVPE